MCRNAGGSGHGERDGVRARIWPPGQPPSPCAKDSIKRSSYETDIDVSRRVKAYLDLNMPTLVPHGGQSRYQNRGLLSYQ